MSIVIHPYATIVSTTIIRPSTFRGMFSKPLKTASMFELPPVHEPDSAPMPAHMFGCMSAGSQPLNSISTTGPPIITPSAPAIITTSATAPSLKIARRSTCSSSRIRLPGRQYAMIASCVGAMTLPMSSYLVSNSPSVHATIGRR